MGLWGVETPLKSVLMHVDRVSGCWIHCSISIYSVLVWFRPSTRAAGRTTHAGSLTIWNPVWKACQTRWCHLLGLLVRLGQRTPKPALPLDYQTCIQPPLRLFNKTPRPRRQALWFIHLRLKEHRYREEISPTPISRSSSLEARNPFRLKPNREDHCASSWTSQFSHWIQWSSLVGWVITRMSVIKVSWHVRVFLLVRWISWASSFISNDRFVLWFTHFNSGFCFTE